MNGIIIQTLRHNNKLSSFHRRKFMSSAALLETPPTEYAHTRNELDPLHILSDPTKLTALTLSETTVLHALLLKSSVIYSDVYVANNLITSYSECSHMDHALKLFDEMPTRNLATWNSMILGCNKNSLFDTSWRFFSRIHNAGLEMDGFTYVSVLSACSALEHLLRGTQVYGLVLKNGFFSCDYVRDGIIDFFSRCRRIEDALRALYENHCENIVCWNVVVSGAVKNKDYWAALKIFGNMCRQFTLIPNAFTFSSVLTACAAVEEIRLGRTIHGCVIKSGAGADVFVGTAVVDFYAKSGAMDDAKKQLKLMPIHNVVSWTSIISGFTKKGDSASAVRVLNDMQKTGLEINSYTMSSVLAACANPSMFIEASQVHCWTIKIGLYLDPVVKASLVNTYANVGAVSLSEIAFADTQDLKQVGIWSNMMSAYIKSEYYEKAIVLFRRMVKEGVRPDEFCVSSILSVIDSLSLGRQVHGCSIKIGVETEVSVGSSIVTMYSKCGDLDESLKAFENLETKDHVSWTSMIAGLAEHGSADKAVQLFREMVFKEPVFDEHVLASVLNACSVFHALKLGREIHGFALRCGFGDHTINEALVNFYSKCGDLNSATNVFHTMPSKDQVSWSSLISGFSQRGKIEEALKLFHDMLLSGTSAADAFTISSLLIAVSSHKSRIGTQLHAYVLKTGLQSETSIGSSLVMMYSKWGSISDCDKAFKQIIDPDLFIFTTMIASYAHHGKGSEALKLFDLMKKTGIEPDGVTFLGVLSACSHAGLIDEGYFHLRSMIKDYGIEPGLKHYTCMVDMLGRGGRLEEAERFIRSMPLEADGVIWESLLAACKVYGNHELANVAAEEIVKLKPSSDAAGAYISVSNICAEAGEWEDVIKIRGSMEATGVRKEPGWSVVSIHN